MSLSPNTIAFIGLTNEFCSTLENAREIPRDEFLAAMLRQLPRIYMMATDLDVVLVDEDEAYIEPLLDEDYYESVRRNVENILGPDDVYLEVFEEDMKYSDTPIAASISEGLSDIFQVLFNFIATIRDLSPEEMLPAIAAVKSDFGAYWSQPLCNVLRALNHVRYTSDTEED